MIILSKVLKESNQFKILAIKVAAKRTLDNALLLIREFITTCDKFSVDIDLTFIPLADRKQSLEDINLHLASICEQAKKAFKGIHIKPNYDTSKLLCEWRGKQVKV